MSMDSTLSITNSTDKRLYEYTDEELWSLLESRERNIQEVPKSSCANAVESPPWFSYELTNGVIYIKLRGGNSEDSSPADLHLPLKDYQWFTMELWDYREITEEMKAASKMENITYKMPDGSDFFITFNVKVWPHLAIDPRGDERFKAQEWAKLFKRDAMGYIAHVTPSTSGGIVRYCDKISDLKVFW